MALPHQRALLEYGWVLIGRMALSLVVQARQVVRVGQVVQMHRPPCRSSQQVGQVALPFPVLDRVLGLVLTSAGMLVQRQTLPTQRFEGCSTAKTRLKQGLPTGLAARASPQT